MIAQPASVYVTHDQVEALALSSRIAVIRDGKIMQMGSRVEGKAVETEHGEVLVDTDVSVATGDAVLLAVRPDGVSIATEPSSGRRANEWAGQVVTRSFLGDSVDHIVRVGAYELRARCTPNVSIRAETPVTVHIDPANLTLIPIDA